MNQNGANMAVGVLQVDDNNGYSAKELCDPYDNAKAAAALYKECGICPWVPISIINIISSKFRSMIPAASTPLAVPVLTVTTNVK
jgi:hypothetical protein